MREEPLKVGFKQHEPPECSHQWAWGPLPGSCPTGIKTTTHPRRSCLSPLHPRCYQKPKVLFFSRPSNRCERAQHCHHTGNLKKKKNWSVVEVNLKIGPVFNTHKFNSNHSDDAHIRQYAHVFHLGSKHWTSHGLG